MIVKDCGQKIVVLKSMHINTKNKKVLVFSDPHQDIAKVRRIVDAECADVNLCLGDWFDSIYYDKNEHVRSAAEYLKDFVSEKRNISIIGNHCSSYLYPSIYTKCSGYEKRKFQIIMDVFGSRKDEVRNKLLWYIWVDDYLCTHAGLHPSFVKFNPTIESIDAFLEIETHRANEKIRNGSDYWVYAAGLNRGGYRDFGGLNWLDFNTEFEPLDDIKQIVGHTSGQRIRAHHSYGGIDVINANNLCIDCHLAEYLVITNGKLEIKQYVNL